VFCHPERGTPYDAGTFKLALDTACVSAGVPPVARAFHDLRHTAITNDAAAGANPIALKMKAGHASMNTTQIYIHLAGVVFRDEADRLERRLLGQEALATDPAPADERDELGTQSGTHVGAHQRI
jgi:integrase